MCKYKYFQNIHIFISFPILFSLSLGYKLVLFPNFIFLCLCNFKSPNNFSDKVSHPKIAARNLVWRNIHTKAYKQHIFLFVEFELRKRKTAPDILEPVWHPQLSLLVLLMNISNFANHQYQVRPLYHRYGPNKHENYL